MQGEAAGDPRRGAVRAILLAGLLIAGGFALVAILDPAIFGLPLGPGIIYAFGGLALSWLILWAARVIRHAKVSALPRAFLQRVGITFVVVQLGFGVAALILFATWLAALMLRPSMAMALLDASIMTILISVLSSLGFRCFLNLAAILQRPASDIPAR